MVAVTVFVAGSILLIEAEPPLPTQIEPLLYKTGAGFD
jgi:hypothetical protein